MFYERLALPVSQLRTGRHLFILFCYPVVTPARQSPPFVAAPTARLTALDFQIDPRLFPAE